MFRSHSEPLGTLPPEFRGDKDVSTNTSAGKISRVIGSGYVVPMFWREQLLDRCDSVRNESVESRWGLRQPEEDYLAVSPGVYSYLRNVEQFRGVTVKNAQYNRIFTITYNIVIIM